MKQLNPFVLLFLGAILSAEPSLAVKKSYSPTLLDSLSAGKELVLTPEKLQVEGVGSVKGDAVPEATLNGSKMVQGYRIQVYATTNFKDAEKKKEDLLASLEEPVFVIYEEPFYKIRVGNFTREDEARELKKKLSEMGNDAWIVQSQVRVRSK